MDRLTLVDEIFLRRHRGYGVPIVMQGVWRTAARMDPAVLESIHEALRFGPLGRRVVRSRVPGARPRWVTATDARPLVYENAPVDDVVAWADACAEVDVDPEFGPGWVLAAAPIAAGGTVISLVCSHVVADAQGLVRAVDSALTGAPAALEPTRTSDVGDALRLVGKVVSGGARALGGLAVSRRRRRELREFTARQPRPGVDAARIVSETSAAVVDIDAGDWDAVASAQDGTANGLFIALVTAIADAAGVPMPLHVSVPVATRPSGAAHNAVEVTEVVVTPNDSLSDIRRLCREAFDRPPMGAPAGFPVEFVQLLPDRTAHRFTAGAGERDALCSNIGRLPRSLETLGPYRTTGVATRAVHPGLQAGGATTTTRLSGYLCSYGATYTLSLVGVDPAHFPDSTRLRELAVGELARWGLTARPW